MRTHSFRGCSSWALVQGLHTSFTWNPCQAGGAAPGKGAHRQPLQWYNHPRCHLGSEMPMWSPGTLRSPPCSKRGGRVTSSALLPLFLMGQPGKAQLPAGRQHGWRFRVPSAAASPAGSALSTQAPSSTEGQTVVGILSTWWNFTTPGGRPTDLNCEGQPRQHRVPRKRKPGTPTQGSNPRPRTKSAQDIK